MQVLALPLCSWMTLGKRLHFPRLQHLRSSDEAGGILHGV